MPLFENKYQKSSFSYSFMLSLLYLPLLFGVLVNNNFMEYKVLDPIVFIPFIITFTTSINYKIMLSLGSKSTKLKNRFLFVIINFMIVVLFYFSLPFDIEIKTVFKYFFILIIPWIYYFSKIYKTHKRTLVYT